MTPLPPYTPLLSPLPLRFLVSKGTGSLGTGQTLLFLLAGFISPSPSSVLPFSAVHPCTGLSHNK